MSRRPTRLLIALVLSLAGLRWIWNSNAWSGRVLITLSRTHGVHLNDWLSIVLWAAAFVVGFPIWSAWLTQRVLQIAPARLRPVQDAVHRESETVA